MEGETAMRYLDKDLLSQRMERFDYTVLGFDLWAQRKPDVAHNDVLGSFKLAILREGRCRVTAGTMTREAARGDALLFAPFVRNHVECLGEEPTRLYYVYFDLAPVEKRADFMSLFHCRQLGDYPGLIPDAVFRQIERTREVVLARRPGCYYSVKLLLHHTLLNILQREIREYRPGGLPAAAEEQVVSRCVEYLDLHISEPVSVSELCNAVNVSQSYLCKCFTRTVGKSTKEFIMTYKFERLEADLRRGRASMQELAARYGFPSAYAFSAAFKKCYGVPPMAYRKHHREAAEG